MFDVWNELLSVFCVISHQWVWKWVPVLYQTKVLLLFRVQMNQVTISNLWLKSHTQHWIWFHFHLLESCLWRSVFDVLIEPHYLFDVPYVVVLSLSLSLSRCVCVCVVFYFEVVFRMRHTLWPNNCRESGWQEEEVVPTVHIIGWDCVVQTTTLLQHFHFLPFVFGLYLYDVFFFITMSLSLSLSLSLIVTNCWFIRSLFSLSFCTYFSDFHSLNWNFVLRYKMQQQQKMYCHHKIRVLVYLCIKPKNT
jgi:hypothetical protein